VTGTLRNIQVGDTVFVVNQQRRHSTTQPIGRYEIVFRVGRKYGFIQRGSCEERFTLDTGHSAHTDCNARANGLGFDVYVSEEHYQKQRHAQTERQRLRERIVTHHGSLSPKLSDKTVAAIHEILDRDQEAQA